MNCSSVQTSPSLPPAPAGAYLSVFSRFTPWPCLLRCLLELVGSIWCPLGWKENPADWESLWKQCLSMELMSFDLKFKFDLLSFPHALKNLLWKFRLQADRTWRKRRAIQACEVAHVSKNKNVREERASSLTDCSVNAHFIENYKKVLNVSVPLIQYIKRLLSRLVF